MSLVPGAYVSHKKVGTVLCMMGAFILALLKNAHLVLDIHLVF